MMTTSVASVPTHAAAHRRTGKLRFARELRQMRERADGVTVELLKHTAHVLVSNVDLGADTCEGASEIGSSMPQTSPTSVLTSDCNTRSSMTTCSHVALGGPWMSISLHLGTRAS